MPTPYGLPKRSDGADGTRPRDGASGATGVASYRGRPCAGSWGTWAGVRPGTS